MDLHIARPNPIPFAFVEKKGSNMLFIFSGSIPGPLSSTEMTIASLPCRSVLIRRILRRPESVFIAYFRPLPGDVSNLFGWLAGFENLILLLVCIWAVCCFRVRYLSNDLFLWAVALLLSWGLAYSVVAYKDLGTAVRFKPQILPILLGIVGFLVRGHLRQYPRERPAA